MNFFFQAQLEIQNKSRQLEETEAMATNFQGIITDLNLQVKNLNSMKFILEIH